MKSLLYMLFGLALSGCGDRPKITAELSCGDLTIAVYNHTHPGNLAQQEWHDAYLQVRQGTDEAHELAMRASPYSYWLPNEGLLERRIGGEFMDGQYGSIREVIHVDLDEVRIGAPLADAVATCLLENHHRTVSALNDTPAFRLTLRQVGGLFHNAPVVYWRRKQDARNLRFFAGEREMLLRDGSHVYGHIDGGPVRVLKVSDIHGPIAIEVDKAQFESGMGAPLSAFKNEKGQSLDEYLQLDVIAPRG